MPQNVALLIIFFTVAVLGLATWITVAPIPAAMERQFDIILSASPLGYTRSLCLVIIPFLVLLYWYIVYSIRHRPHWRCFLLTALIVGISWALLDFFFAGAIFYFPNCKANLELYLPGYVPGYGIFPSIPIEEFIFYLFSVLLLLIVYMWASEVWFPHGSLSETDHLNEGNLAIPMVNINPFALVAGIGLIVIGILIQRRLGHLPFLAPLIPNQCGLPPPHGFSSGKVFPLYFTCLVVILFVPSAFLFNRVKTFVNAGALHFTILIAVLISLVWEVTLALPYGWWGYQPDFMLGIYIKPWFNLPIESVLLWVSAGWGAVFIYEFIRLKCITGKSLFALAFGRAFEVEPPAPGNIDPDGDDPSKSVEDSRKCTIPKIN